MGTCDQVGPDSSPRIKTNQTKLELFSFLLSGKYVRMCALKLCLPIPNPCVEYLSVVRENKTIMQRET